MAKVSPEPEGSDPNADSSPGKKPKESGSDAGSCSGTKQEESDPKPASKPSAAPADAADGPPASAPVASAAVPPASTPVAPAAAPPASAPVAPAVAPPAAAPTATGIRLPLLDRTGEQPPKRAMLSFACHPLSKEATIAFLTKAADASVMGLVTLNVFYATYLLAWGQPGSLCIPSIPKPAPDGSKEVIKPSWVQLVVGSLPFIVLPLTLFVSGLVQAAGRDGHALGFVAALCLTEFTAAILLGGGMFVCMKETSWMWLVPALVIVVMILIWGLTFKYPEWLRKFIWSKCFRQDIDVPELNNVLVDTMRG